MSDLHLEIGNTEGIQRQLAENALDVGLTEGLAEADELDAEVFFMDELVAIVPADHPLLKATLVTAERLCREPFILREPGSGTRAVVERALAKKRLSIALRRAGLPKTLRTRTALCACSRPMDIPANEPPLSYLQFTLPPRDITDDDLLNAFLEYVKHLGLELYPAQEEGVLELLAGKNVILNTPTGSGKSLVATAMHFRALALQQRSVYTAPIKALVNEKFFALCRDFGAQNVGMLTGDAAVNRDAPILCCTAEILANMALAEGADLDVGAVIIDEFHYYSDRDRGTAWQVPLLTLPQATFLLMSATFGDATFFQEELTKLTGRETAVVSGGERPVPLDFETRVCLLSCPATRCGSRGSPVNERQGERL